MQTIQQPHQIATRRPQPRSGRNVGDRHNLDPIGNPEEPQRFAGEGVFHLIDMIHKLGLRIAHANFVVHDRRIHVQVHVLVDAHGQNEAALLAVERGQIGPAAAEREPEWCPRDNHCSSRALIRRDVPYGLCVRDQYPGKPPCACFPQAVQAVDQSAIHSLGFFRAGGRLPASPGGWGYVSRSSSLRRIAARLAGLRH